MKRPVCLMLALVILAVLIGPIVYTQIISGSGLPGPGEISRPGVEIADAENPAAGVLSDGTGSSFKTENPYSSTLKNNPISSGSGERLHFGTVNPGETDPSKDTAFPAKERQVPLEEIIPADITSSTCEVNIAVVGMKNQIIYGPAPVAIPEDNKWGFTVLGALDATGLEYEMSSVYGNLVISIAGQVNKGMCGWMYKVNDEVAMVAASEKKIKAGDKIIWWYSEEISNSGPDWDSLKSVL